jgi:hypothetical protein
MLSNFLPRIIAFSLLAGFTASHAAIGEDTLRQAAIHAKYRDGSFEAVVETLEGFLKTHKSFRREDSLFIAKHLAVVHASHPARREKGKYHMRRLLELDPSSNLMDMYVSDEIDRVWEKVRAEYFAARGGPPMDNPPTRKEFPASQGNPNLKVAAWTVIGLAAAGAGLLAYFLISGGETDGKTFNVDARTPQP